MSQAIGSILSLILGFFIWMIVILLSQGAYPFGSSGFLEWIIFFPPIIIVVAPAALKRIEKGSVATGIFLLAISPIFGLLNCIPFFFLVHFGEMIYGKNGYAAFYFAGILNTLPWLVLLILKLRNAQLQHGPADQK